MTRANVHSTGNESQTRSAVEGPCLQLSLRGMMGLTALVAGVVAVWIEFGSMTGIGATFVALLISAHLLGAVLGKSNDSGRDSCESLNPGNYAPSAKPVAGPSDTSQTMAPFDGENAGEFNVRIVGEKGDDIDGRIDRQIDRQIDGRIDVETKRLWRPVLVGLPVVGGGAAGVMFGGGSLFAVYADRLNWWNGSVAVLATGAVGSLLGFGVGNLLIVCTRSIGAMRG